MVITLLLRYWKPLAGIALIFTILLGAYYKGRMDANKAWESYFAIEIANRYQAWEQTKQVNDNISKKIYKNRGLGQNDTYDSCLLSTDPIKDICK